MDELSEFAERVENGGTEEGGHKKGPPKDPSQGKGGPPVPPGSRRHPRVPRSHGV